MTLSPGTRLGPYEVADKIGAGGMGEVYRATDTNLKRQVAIKVLPEAVANDQERLARFRREAEVLASLNHPNIAQIHGLERSDGTTALVMELVEGPTLADRIAQGPIPVDEAIHVARQIAEALEAAHERGIVHRDLKPANVKVRPDGTVKVLDFGLAKAVESPATSSANQTLSPTITTPAMTQAGMILGTAAYMSPEQAKGRTVDARTDVWAFGAVLYEMLAGRPAFHGDGVSETLAKIIEREPDFEALPGRTPAGVRRLLRHCLEKDPARRLRHPGDARLFLDAEPDAPAPVARASGASPWVTVTVAVVAMVAVAVAATLLLARAWLQPPAPEVIVFHEPPPDGAEFAFAPLPSPDGRLLALRTLDADGTLRLWVRPTDSEDARRVDTAEGAALAFWSPDSAELAFFADGELRRVSSQGGTPRLVARLDIAPEGGGVWTRDGNLVVVSRTDGIVSVPASGGTARSIIRAEDTLYWTLQPAPGSDRIVFVEFAGEAPGLYSARANGEDRTLLLAGDMGSVRSVAPDLLVHDEGGRIVAHRLDASGTRVVGDAIPIEERWRPVPDSSSSARFSNQYDSGGSTLSFLPGESSVFELAWMDREGRRMGTEGVPGLYEEVHLTPDGETIVYTQSTEGNSDLWTRRVGEEGARRLSLDPGVDHMLAISPDGEMAAWESHGEGGLDVVRRPLDGSAPVSLLRRWGRAGGVNAWSADGRFLLYRSSDGATGSNLWAVPLDGAEPSVLFESPFNIMWGRLSPDGRAVAFTSDETGATEVYVQSLDGMRVTGAVTRVSANGGTYPLWGRGGRELYFISQGRLIVAAITHADGAIRLGTPAALFPMDFPRGVYTPYAATPDGERFLVIMPTDKRAAQPATVVLNWAATLAPAE